MESPKCCSKTTEAIISRADLESECLYWKNWLAKEATQIEGYSEGFTNKHLIYWNAFISQYNLQNRALSWFLFVNANKKHDTVEVLACDITELKSPENQTIVDFLSKYRNDPRFFLVVFKRNDTHLLFIKCHCVRKHLVGDTQTERAYDEHLQKHGCCIPKSNFFCDDDDSIVFGEKEKLGPTKTK